VSEKVSERSPSVDQAREAPTQEQKVPCEVYSRIVGYVRPVRNWNTGKKQEFAERQTYRVDSSVTGEVSECEEN
jgi:hypothetical protein